MAKLRIKRVAVNTHNTPRIVSKSQYRDYIRINRIHNQIPVQDVFVS